MYNTLTHTELISDWYFIITQITFVFDLKSEGCVCNAT